MRKAGKTCVMALTILFILLPLVSAPGCKIQPDMVPGIFGQEHSADRGYITITFHNNSTTEEVEVFLLGDAALDPLPPRRQIPPGGDGSFTIPKAQVSKAGVSLSWKAVDRGGFFTVGEDSLTVIIHIPSQPTPTSPENKRNEQHIMKMLDELKKFDEHIIERPGQGAWKDDVLVPLTKWAKGKQASGGPPNTTTEPGT